MMSLTASPAMIEPTWPHKLPITPASPQLDVAPAGGGLGKRSRRHTPGSLTPNCRARPPVQNTEICAEYRRIDPHTSGIDNSEHAASTV